MNQVLHVWIDGVGLLGPGLDSWEQGRAVLAGEVPALAEKTRVPTPTTLPAAERRRAGMAVKAAIAVGLQALQPSGVDAKALATVFTSSGGDGVNCHEICQALASSDRLISPTRFHNSVHNAPSGYWSISTGAMATSSVLCAHDGSFAAGLLEAVSQCAVEGEAVLLVSYDTDYPEPLRGVRPIPDTFGTALLLSPQLGPHSLAQLSLQPADALAERPVNRMADPALEQLRTAIPTARALPLLQAVACREGRGVVLDYLERQPLALQVAPCR